MGVGSINWSEEVGWWKPWIPPNSHLHVACNTSLTDQILLQELDGLEAKLESRKCTRGKYLALRTLLRRLSGFVRIHNVESLKIPKAHSPSSFAITQFAPSYPVDPFFFWTTPPKICKNRFYFFDQGWQSKVLIVSVFHCDSDYLSKLLLDMSLHIPAKNNQGFLQVDKLA
ncbi:UNVERIFIED_CONTAM: hypothetical protein Sindi_2243000 [Sesamum indicum]